LLQKVLLEFSFPSVFALLLSKIFAGIFRVFFTTTLMIMRYLFFLFFFFVTKSFAGIFLRYCFCALSSQKLCRNISFLPTTVSEINSSTLKYLKLQITPWILSLIWEVSLRIYTFKPAGYLPEH